MKIGNSNIDKVYIGATEIEKVYIGANQIYPTGGGGGGTVFFDPTPHQGANTASSIGWGIFGSGWNDKSGSGYFVSNNGPAGLSVTPEPASLYTGGTQPNTGILTWPQSTPSGNASFSTTKIASLNIPIETVTKVSWYMGNANTGSYGRVMVRVGGAWYVHVAQHFNTLATASNADFAANAQLFEQTLNGALTGQWKPVGDGGDSHGDGSAAVAGQLTGNIEAIGVWTFANFAIVRIKSIKVEAS